jgi:hypothetical protein
MYTKHRHELRHVRKAEPGTLVDTCLLSEWYNKETLGREELPSRSRDQTFGEVEIKKIQRNHLERPEPEFVNV